MPCRHPSRPEPARPARCPPNGGNPTAPTFGVCGSRVIRLPAEIGRPEVLMGLAAVGRESVMSGKGEERPDIKVGDTGGPVEVVQATPLSEDNGDEHSLKVWP